MTSSTGTEASHSPGDHEMIQACLEHRPFAWQSFVDRNLATVISIIGQINEANSLNLTEARRDSLAEDVFRQLRANDFELLRKFHENGTFRTFLIICTRRIVLSQTDKD